MKMLAELAERANAFEQGKLEPTPMCDCGNEVTSRGDICPRCLKERQQGYQVLTMTGRRANGGQLDAGRLYHAVGMDNVAFCGAKHGRRSDWSMYHGDEVTCPRCLKRIASIERRVKVAIEMDDHRRKYLKAREVIEQLDASTNKDEIDNAKSAAYEFLNEYPNA